MRKLERRFMYPWLVAAFVQCLADFFCHTLMQIMIQEILVPKEEIVNIDASVYTKCAK